MRSRCCDWERYKTQEHACVRVTEWQTTTPGVINDILKAIKTVGDNDRQRRRDVRSMTVASLNTRNFINVVRGLKPDTHYPFERAVWTGSVYPHLWTTIDRLTTTNILMWSYKIDLLDVNFYEIIIRAIFFTARCYAERSIATANRLSVCPSVRYVKVSWSHRLEIFKNNFTAS